MSGDQTVDFGFVIPNSIGSYVWQDTNLDGVQDATESPIEGALVTLLVDDGTGNFVAAVDVDGAAVPSVTTGPDGLYEFENLPPADYVVQVTPPSVFVPTPVQTVANDDDSEADSNICLLYTSPSPRDATLSRMPSSA